MSQNEGKDISVQELSFELALGKLVKLHTNLVSTKTTFNSLCDDLLDGWDGKAAVEAEKAVSDLKAKFESCVNNLEITRKMLNSSFEDFMTTDLNLSKEIDEKIVIN